MKILLHELDIIVDLDCCLYLMHEKAVLTGKEKYNFKRKDGLEMTSSDLNICKMNAHVFPIIF